MLSEALSVLSGEDSAEDEVAVGPSGMGDADDSGSICDVARVMRRRKGGEDGPAVDWRVREVGMWLIEL